MKRTIITINDGDTSKILRIPAQVVLNETEIRNILKDLIDSLPLNGVGLAAPQIGFNKRVFIVRDGDKILKFVNPKLSLLSHKLEESIDIESCLSIPGRNFLVSRFKSIQILNDDKRNIFEGKLARIIQHEYWHLAGILIDINGREIIDETNQKNIVAGI